MRGLTLRITNPTSSRANLTDIPGVSGVAAGETIEVLYTDDVQQSLEYGSLNTHLSAGRLTSSFVSGTILTQAPIGATMVGATPTTDGVRGLAPRPQIADRASYLKGDGSWAGITPLSIGAIPESKLTTQGDILFRGVTTSERLPFGTLGQVLRSGLANPQWQSNALTGTIGARPAADASYAGVLYWTTDTLVLYICHHNGTSWVWSSLSAAAFTWMEDWDTLVSYLPNQAVRRLGDAYVSLTENAASAPESNPLDWSPMTDVRVWENTFTVNGDMVFRNGAGTVTRLPVGTVGQILSAQTSGMSVVPTWVDNPKIVYTETTLASNASVDGTTLNAWFTVGSRRIVPANHANTTLEFCAEGIVSGGGLTGDVRLYDATAAAVVTTFAFTDTSPTVAGASQRIAVAIPGATSQWLVQIRVTATGLPSDSFNLTAAFLAATAS